MPLHFAVQNRQVLFWRLQAVGWSAMVFVSFAVVTNGDYGGWLAFTIGFYRQVLGFGLTSWVLRPLLRLALRRQTPAISTGVGFVLLCALMAWSDTALTRILAEWMQSTNAAADQYMRTSIMLRWVLYCLWCGFYYFIRYWLDTQEAQLRLAHLETEMRTAELQRLRAQVNPHFLFNAFNSILAETENPEAVAALTQGVAEYLRFSLRQPESGQSLGEELDALDHYLQVEKIRFEERLEFSFTTDDNARRCRVPGALVQPLVENAIKYGQRTSPPPLRLSIDTRVKNKSLTIAVGNTGKWIEPDPARGGGIGLSNLRRRLELIFGSRAGVEVSSDSGWVRVVLRLPAEMRV